MVCAARQGLEHGDIPWRITSADKGIGWPDRRPAAPLDAAADAGKIDDAAHARERRVLHDQPMDVAPGTIRPCFAASAVAMYVPDRASIGQHRLSMVSGMRLNIRNGSEARCRFHVRVYFGGRQPGHPFVCHSPILISISVDEDRSGVSAANSGSGSGVCCYLACFCNCCASWAILVRLRGASVVALPPPGPTDLQLKFDRLMKLVMIRWHQKLLHVPPYHSCANARSP